jgi:hypothetical protein
MNTIAEVVASALTKESIRTNITALFDQCPKFIIAFLSKTMLYFLLINMSIIQAS